MYNSRAARVKKCKKKTDFICMSDMCVRRVGPNNKCGWVIMYGYTKLPTPEIVLYAFFLLFFLCFLFFLYVFNMLTSLREHIHFSIHKYI